MLSALPGSERFCSTSGLVVLLDHSMRLCDRQPKSRTSFFDIFAWFMFGKRGADAGCNELHWGYSLVTARYGSSFLLALQ
jgi:hypothetical protein